MVSRRQKINARRTVQRALKSGKLVKPGKCEQCPSAIKVEAHHEDYNKPLEVNWLCRECHTKKHRVLSDPLPRKCKGCEIIFTPKRRTTEQPEYHNFDCASKNHTAGRFKSKLSEAEQLQLINRISLGQDSREELKAAFNISEATFWRYKRLTKTSAL